MNNFFLFQDFDQETEDSGEEVRSLSPFLSWPPAQNMEPLAKKKE
jgi:hypothetical protein